MSQEGQRIEFTDKGPYLFEPFETEPRATLLQEHNVCLIQFGELYLPVALDVAGRIADALTNLTQADMGPEREGMTPLAFDQDVLTELPLLTDVAEASFQHGDTVYMDVSFGPTEARLCFSVKAAAIVGQVMSQVPAR